MTLCAHAYLDWSDTDRGVSALVESLTSRLGWAVRIAAGWVENGRERGTEWGEPTESLLRRLDRAAAGRQLQTGMMMSAAGHWNPHARLGQDPIVFMRRRRHLIDPQPPFPDSIHISSRERVSGCEADEIIDWYRRFIAELPVQYGGIATLRDWMACQRDITCGPATLMGREKTEDEREHERAVSWQNYPPNRMLWNGKARSAYWANVLTPAMVEGMGGLEVALAEAPVWLAEPLAGGRVYLQLSEHLPASDDMEYLDKLAKLREWMKPVLLPPPPDWFPAP